MIGDPLDEFIEFDATMGSDVVDNPDTPGSNSRTMPAGLSHIMWPTGRHPRLWKKGDIAPEEHR